MVHSLLAAGVGYVVGAFTPAVGRKIKALFVSKSAAVKPTVVADLAKAEAAVISEAKKL
jgi:hypothetical protein